MITAPTPPVSLLVMAKAPEPGRTKTRLCPPCSPVEAAALAEAALADTLAAVAAAGRRAHCRPRPVLVLDGRPGPWLPPGFAVVAQRGEGLAERLANAFDDAGGPALLVGMDTPQVTPAALAAALDALARPGVDAVLGLAGDGGWWALGLRRPEWRALVGVPMSTPRTGAAQRRRLAALGLRVAPLPVLRDVDTWPDALHVAALAPNTRFAAAVQALGYQRDWPATAAVNR